VLTLDHPEGWAQLTAYCERERRIEAEVESLWSEAQRFPHTFALDRARTCAAQDEKALAFAQTDERRAFWSKRAAAWRRVATRIEATDPRAWGEASARRHYAASVRVPEDRTGLDADGWRYASEAMLRGLRA
jgi:hypothetical protein